MKTIKYILIFFLTVISYNKANAQHNMLTSQEYATVKIDNVFLQDIISTSGDSVKMQNLFGNSFTIEKGFNEATEHWIKFYKNSLCIEFYYGIENNSIITYDLANIEILNNSSKLMIKNTSVTLGTNLNVFSNVQAKISLDKKILIFKQEGLDSYLYIYANPSSNLVTKLGFKGNLL